MTKLLTNALKAISHSCNKSDGGTHPMDKDRINETFLRLHKAGEILTRSDIQDWLEDNGWSAKHAERVGSIAQQIGEGKVPVIKDGPCWKDDILQQWQDEE